MLAVGVMLFSCGFTAFAAEAPEIAPPISMPLPPYPEDMTDEIYPADIQTVIEGDMRQIVKTYTLMEGQDPADIPRDIFELGGWLYILTGITETRTSGTDTRSHTETVEISTDSNDLNAILIQLAPTMVYQSEDGYGGTLTLELSSVTCEAAGYRNSSYTVSATREYPHLSDNDLSLIPKTITDSGRTLTLDDVTWEVQNYINVDYEYIPDSYRAVATYTATASKSVVTGYVTMANYTGEVTKMVTGDTVYTAIFWGSEIIIEPEPTTAPTPTATPEPSPSAAPVPSVPDDNSFPLVPTLISLAVLALAVAGLMFFPRNYVRVYSAVSRSNILILKLRISAKHPIIDLTKLDGDSFYLKIDKAASQRMSGTDIEVRQGPATLYSKITYEGKPFHMEANFREGTIETIY